MGTIVPFRVQKPGYDPFLIREGWQVAYLQWDEGLGFNSLTHLERHRQTDEVFLLLRGAATLVTAEQPSLEHPSLQITSLETKVVYNVPCNVWHAIALSPDALVVIVETNQTHIHDVEKSRLSPEDQESLRKKLN